MRPFVIASLLLGMSIAPAQAESTQPPAAAEVSADIKSGQVLAGSWVRPDGGYILQINKVEENGILQAAYLNPRSIRVASARWRFGGNRLQIRIDLNDTGYEGSYYLLQYNSDSGKLEGEYTPAGQGVFPVEFERQLGPLHQ